MEILAFGGRREPQKTADFRRKPKIFAENRRKQQIGLRHLRRVTFSSALYNFVLATGIRWTVLDNQKDKNIHLHVNILSSQQLLNNSGCPRFGYGLMLERLAVLVFGSCSSSGEVSVLLCFSTFPQKCPVPVSVSSKKGSGGSGSAFGSRTFRFGFCATLIIWHMSDML